MLAYSSVPDDLSFTDTMVDGLDWPHPLGRMASRLSEGAAAGLRAQFLLDALQHGAGGGAQEILVVLFQFAR